ncbi:MAG: GntR family transcriptional regulator [Advenella sp.]
MPTSNLSVPSENGSEISLSEQAHRSLQSMILSGELAPAELITERQLALQLGISRTPLREAIRRLEGARLLERQKSGALVVRSLPIEELINILDVRRVLEGEAARLAAGHVPQPVLERIRQRAKAVLSLSDNTKLSEPPDEEELHLLVASAADNPVLKEVIIEMRTRTAMFRFGRQPARRHEVAQEHLAVVDALESGDGQAARQAMEHHIEQVRATIIARITGRNRIS